MNYIIKYFNSDIIKKYILNENSCNKELIFCEKIRINDSTHYPHVEDMFVFKHNEKYYGVINGYCGDSGLYSEGWNIFVKCFELEKYDYKYQNCEEIKTGIWHNGYSYRYIGQ